MPISLQHDTQGQQYAFPRSISQPALAIKKRLEEKLKNDLKKPDGHIAKVHYLETFSKFSFRLPWLGLRSREFMQYFLNQVLDNNIDFDLYNAKIINWWLPSLKKLYPLSTVGDGNCLLHAVSQALFGCHDHTHFLRRLMYVVIVSDQPEEFQERWKREQKYQDECERQLGGITLSTMQWQRQWEEIVKNAEDKINTTDISTTAMESLESIHIFVIVNILRRPIIVLCESVVNDFHGRAIGHNHLGGIYLPLLWKPSDCVRTPIVLAYHYNHFVPMLSMMDSPDADLEQTKHGVPLVSHDLQQLPLHFLSEREERGSANLLTMYLDMFEVRLTVGQESVLVPYAKFHFHDIDSQFNILDEYMTTVDHTFLTQQGAHNHIVPSAMLPAGLAGSPPLEPTAPSPSLISNMSDMSLSIHTVPQTTPAARPTEVPDPRAAAAQNVFFPPQRSTSYPPRPQPSQSTRPTALATYPPPRTTPVCRDLSITGEECAMPDCTYYSSTETYPYCHECHSKLIKMRQSQRLPNVDERQEEQDRREGDPDEVFSGRTSRTRLTDRQRSISYEEEEEHELQGRHLDDQPLSIPYTVNTPRIHCSHPNCPKRGKGVCEGKCHEHYRNIGAGDLRNVCTGEHRTRSRSGVDPRGSGSQFGRENRAEMNASGRMDPGSAGEPSRVDPGTRRRGADPEAPSRSGQSEPVRRPASAATYPPTSPPAGIGRSFGRIPGELMEPTSMLPPAPCNNPTCTNLGSESNEGFCQRCFNAICIAQARMARGPRRERLDFPPTPRLPCQTPHCVLYAKPDLGGYCELCFHRLFDRESVSSSVSTPTSPPAPAQGREPATAPTMASKCIVPECTRYGDPAFQGSCKRCLDLQNQATLGILGLTRNPRASTSHAAPQATPNDPRADSAIEDQFASTMKATEKASKRATGRCRNDRCENYGNSSCRGYCNRCYQSTR